MRIGYWWGVSLEKCQKGAPVLEFTGKKIKRFVIPAEAGIQAYLR